jgi:multiple antibiotic resistance protein
MIEVATVAFTTFFATIGPLDVAAVYAGLTVSKSSKERFSIALRGTIIATIVLLLFAVLGQKILTSFGISLAAFRAAGGILLLLIGIEMVFARDSGATSTTDDEEEEARTRSDIAAFPIATPLIAGPGAIGAVVLMMAGSEGDYVHQSVVIGALIATLLVTFLSMLLASRLHRIFGVTGIQVVSRVMGVLITALAVQFIFDGITQSGLIPGS